MVRTKADAARKAGGKAPRKAAALTGRSSSKVSKSGKKGRSGGGNSYCRRPTPSWQIPITKLFKKSDEGSTSVDKTPEDEVVEISPEVVEIVPGSSVNEPGTSGTSSVAHLEKEATDDTSSSEMEDMDSEGESVDEDDESDGENNEAEFGEEIETESGEEIEAESDENNTQPVDDKEPLNGHGKQEIESNNMDPSDKVKDIKNDAE